MEAHRRTFFTDRGVAVRSPAGTEPGGTEPGHTEPGYTEIDLFAGAMHYWRLDRRDWRACLAAMSELGLRVVDTYIPWGVHEVRAGQYDWRREYDVAAFLDCVAEAGMYAVVRPGPHINAELTYFGYPERIVRRRDIQAVSGRDTPVWLPAPPRMFPVPSHAAGAFRSEVCGWYAAVAEIVAPRMAPDGPVIAVQVDNEAQMFFRLGAYDHDYHPDALAWWDEYSGGREPPRAWDPAHAERCVAWVQFKEEYVARSLAWMSQALQDAGLDGVARFHNLPPSEPTLINPPRVRAAMGGLVGQDFYYRARDYALCRRRGAYLVGTADKLPYVPELGVGGALWIPHMTAWDQENVILGLLACGVRGFNLYMTVARERWYGAPISERGEVRAPGPWLQRLLTVLADIDWTGLRRRVPVALISSRADARFALASSVIDPVTPVLGELLGGLGPGGAGELALDPAAATQRRWMAATERALDLAQVPYDIVDEASSLAHLARYPVIIAPTLERVDRVLWSHLHELARRGVTVVIGPGKPHRDQRGKPLGGEAAPPPGVGLIRPESLDDLEGYADDLTELVVNVSEDWLTEEWLAEQEDVDCSLFVDSGGAPRVLFVGNRGESRVAAEVLVPGGTELMDALSEQGLAADSQGIIEVVLEPYQVRMLLVA